MKRRIVVVVEVAAVIVAAGIGRVIIANILGISLARNHRISMIYDQLNRDDYYPSIIIKKLIVFNCLFPQWSHVWFKEYHSLLAKMKMIQQLLLDSLHNSLVLELFEWTQMESYFCGFSEYPECIHRAWEPNHLVSYLDTTAITTIPSINHALANP